MTSRRDQPGRQRRHSLADTAPAPARGLGGLGGRILAVRTWRLIRVRMRCTAARVIRRLGGRILAVHTWKQSKVLPRFCTSDSPRFHRVSVRPSVYLFTHPYVHHSRGGRRRSSHTASRQKTVAVESKCVAVQQHGGYAKIHERSTLPHAVQYVHGAGTGWLTGGG
jgi:hypothetical protein